MPHTSRWDHAPSRQQSRSQSRRQALFKSWCRAITANRVRVCNRMYNEPKMNCPHCNSPSAEGKKYCADCGTPLDPRTEHLESFVKAQIEESIKEKFKDQKLVDIETSQAIAERLHGWAKMFGFFIFCWYLALLESKNTVISKSSLTVSISK